LWVVTAVTLFVWLMSRSPLLTGLAFVVFAFLAWAFRPTPGEKPVPIMLAIAAVTLSCMHQSSLGSLFLLMPDKLEGAWWSPIMPLSFLLSAIAGGIALVILVEMWIAKVWDRKLRMPQLASLGKIGFWALLVYEVVRIGDLVVRGQLGAAVSDKSSAALFVIEVVIGGAVPLVLLSSAKLRESSRVLFWGCLLSCGGVIFDRCNVVIFAMNLRGPMPFDPQPYTPHPFEWGLSIGLIAATIFLFGLAARHLPVLPKEETH
jgi:formate dehydrogenase iron-sulfur subunit